MTEQKERKNMIQVYPKKLIYNPKYKQIESKRMEKNSMQTIIKKELE